MWVWAVPAGLAVGLALGALGGGGSILTVPARVYLLGQPVYTATTGSLIIVGASALTGAMSHRRAGTLRLASGITFGVLGTVGSFAGTRLAAGVSPPVLLSAFAGLMLVVAVLMVRRTRSRPATAPPAADDDDGATRIEAQAPPRGRLDLPLVTRTLAAATVVGLLTGFFGVGGGFAVVPALVLALGFSMPTAVGTSLLVISINAATALLARSTAGAFAQVDWLVIGVFAVVAAGGSLLGARVSRRVDERLLSAAFATLLVAIAAYLAIVNVPLIG